MPAFIDLTGKKFGRLTVVSRGPNAKHNMPRWHCRCECGNETLSWGQSLRDGYAQSCGCLSDEINTERARLLNYRHGEAGKGRTSIYRIWCGVMGRCLNPSHGAYKKYGAKGITICERWKTYGNFRDDMGEKPTPKHTLDRIDGTKGYEPGNCRWATMKEQNNNRIDNVKITFNGETLTAPQWAERLGLKSATITARIRRGDSPEQALRPVK